MLVGDDWSGDAAGFVFSFVVCCSLVAGSWSLVDSDRLAARRLLFLFAMSLRNGCGSRGHGGRTEQGRLLDCTDRTPTQAEASVVSRATDCMHRFIATTNAILSIQYADPLPSRDNAFRVQTLYTHTPVRVCLLLLQSDWRHGTRRRTAARKQRLRWRLLRRSNRRLQPQVLVVCWCS